jgi:hypothetical protein
MKIQRQLLHVFAVAWLAQARPTHAVPAAPGPFRFHQTDGREITLRVLGDEWLQSRIPSVFRPLASSRELLCFKCPTEASGFCRLQELPAPEPFPVLGPTQKVKP